MNEHLYRSLKAKYDRRKNNPDALWVYYDALVSAKVTEAELIDEIERRGKDGK